MCYIKNINDFIYKIGKLKNKLLRDGFSESAYEIVYRAFSKKYCGILTEVPSLFSKDLEGKEKEIFNDFIASNPNEFKNMTTFDILTKMRHYAVPNRLLDVTFDPLLALYFACGKDNSVVLNKIKTAHIVDDDTLQKIKDLFDGSHIICVYAVKKEYIKNFDSDTVTVLSALTKLKPEHKIYLKIIVDYFFKKYKNKKADTPTGFGAWNNISEREKQKKDLFDNLKKTKKLAGTLKKVLNKNKNNDKLTIKQLFNFCVDALVGELTWQIKKEIPSWYESILDLETFTHCYLVKPKYNNPRIVAQSGAFFIYPFKHTNIKKSLINNESYIFKYTKRDTKIISKELDILYIKESKYFPDDLNVYAKEIEEKYKNL